MRLTNIMTLVCLWAATLAFAQPDLSKKADSLYRAKSYAEAGKYYHQWGDQGWMKAMRKTAYYNAACSFARANDVENAFENLNLSVINGYANKTQLESDSDLLLLHSDSRWTKTLASLKKTVGETPQNLKFISSDIDLFYRAFALAVKDSVKAKQIFRKEYFGKGSDGLQDFFMSKIGGEDRFVQTVFKNRDFYANAKSTLLQVGALKGPIYKNAATFEDLYPQAVFPNLYFVVGRFSSNGTISDNGLIIGTEQMSKTPKTDTSKWKDWQREWIMNFSQIPITVAHELVHFNQDGMKHENTLLCYAMIEGSAEFIAELVTGQTDGDYTAFKGRQQQIWQDFKNEMMQDVYEEWVEASAKRPRNAMYWAGYIVSKAYYENASDKKQAVYDILHIQDYQAFFEKSQADRLMSRTQ